RGRPAAVVSRSPPADRRQPGGRVADHAAASAVAAPPRRTVDAAALRRRSGGRRAAGCAAGPLLAGIAERDARSGSRERARTDDAGRPGCRAVTVEACGGPVVRGLVWPSAHTG